MPPRARYCLTVQQPFDQSQGRPTALRTRRVSVCWRWATAAPAADPQNNGQNLNMLLGKAACASTSTSALPYAIPPDNPFVGTAGRERRNLGLRPAQPVALQLRSPDRRSIRGRCRPERLWEEVDMQPAAGGGGRNYGWRLMEGRHCFNPSSGCNNGTLILPIVEYAHPLGCSITGGFRYRGSALADYVGTYVFGDLCNGIISGATVDAQGAWHVTQLLDTTHTITTFGEDTAGELYVSNYGSSGELYRAGAGRHGAGAAERHAGSRPAPGASPVLRRCSTAAMSATAELAPGTVVTLAASADGGPGVRGWGGDPDCAGRHRDDDRRSRMHGAVRYRVHRQRARGRHDCHQSRPHHRVAIADRCLTGGAKVWERSRGPIRPSVPGATLIKAVHVMELRTALDQVYAARKQTPPVYTDAALAGIVVKAAARHGAAKRRDRARIELTSEARGPRNDLICWRLRARSRSVWRTF